MGYPIETTWAKMREADIKKLNGIIDNEYMIELEIGHKLNIMKKFEEAFEKQVSEFDFESVLSYMKSVGWKWASYDGGLHYETPTREVMIERMMEFLNEGLYDILERNKTDFYVSSGGLVLFMEMVGNAAYVSIHFDIAHFVK